MRLAADEDQGGRSRSEEPMDVHLTLIVMKKNRPAVQLSLLCAARDEARFRALVLRHITSFGLKSFPLEKTELERRMIRKWEVKKTDLYFLMKWLNYRK